MSVDGHNGPNEAAPQAEAQADTRVSLTQVKKNLETLLSAESVNDPEARAAQSILQQIATSYGAYRTATEIYGYVTGAARLSDSEGALQRSRGFELAGELFFLHLQHEIDSIEDSDKPLGPSIFKTYCDELFDSFFRGDHVRKGIGFPIMIMERLMTKAVSSHGHADLYVKLAEQALNSAIELSKLKFERDRQEARRASRMHKRGETPPPRVKSADLTLDEDVLDYLQDVRRRFRQFSELVSKSSALNSTNGSDEVLLATLQVYLDAAEKMGYPGLAGLLKERAGTFLAANQPNKARAYLFSAARDFERLADQEYSLHLTKMAVRRYRRAHKLYTLTKSAPEAARVKSKIMEAKSSHDAELLTIAQL